MSMPVSFGKVGRSLCLPLFVTLGQRRRAKLLRVVLDIHGVPACLIPALEQLAASVLPLYGRCSYHGFIFRFLPSCVAPYGYAFDSGEACTRLVWKQCFI